uniref:Putative secreted protein n=1 Tax=Ixodes ricinus TaxID=34613 RepID=A0A6B0TWD9_IXORI
MNLQSSTLIICMILFFFVVPSDGFLYALYFQKRAFNSFSWCCKPASTTCGPSTRMKSSKAQSESLPAQGRKWPTAD